MSTEKAGGLFSFPIRRPVTITMLFFGMVVFGGVALMRIPTSLMPDLAYPSLTVRTEFEGAAPEEVEEHVSREVEDTLGVIPNLRRITSLSKTGRSDVILEFAWGTDMSAATQDVSERLATIQFGQDIGKPLLLRYDPSLDPVIRLSLTGEPDLMRQRTFAEEYLKRELERVDGVAAVKIKGGLEEELHVLVRENDLTSRGISMDQIENRLRQENLSVAGGKLKEGTTEYVVRAVNEFQHASELKDIVVGRSGETPIRLADVADIERGNADRQVIIRVNGKEGVQLDIYREGDANLVNLSKKVMTRLFPEGDARVATPEAFAARQAERGPAKGGKPQGGGGGRRGRGGGVFAERPLVGDLLPGSHLSVVSDQAKFVAGAIHEVNSAVLWGGVLAVLVLYLFLRKFTTTMVVAVSIPVSVVTAFGAMMLTDLSLNIMSLGGLALGVGMLVDNSIVVLESIFRCREEGDAPADAALRGTSEVGMAVVASTLTTVAVFAPIVFVEGVAGQIFRDLALTVVYSLVASLLVALFFVPMLALVAARAEGAGESVGPVPLRARVRTALSLRGYREARADLGAFFVKRKDAQDRGSLRPLGVLLAPVAVLLFCIRLLFVSAGLVITGVLLGLFLLAGLAGVAGRFLERRVLVYPLRAFEHLFQRVISAYRRFLGLCLDHRATVLSVAFLSLLLTTAALLTRDAELLPEVSQGVVNVDAAMPVGTPLEATDAAVLSLQQAPEGGGIVEISAMVGADPEDILETEAGDHTVRMDVRVAPGGRLTDREDAAAAQVRDQASRVPGLQARFSRPSLFESTPPLEVQITGYDLSTLLALSDQAARVIEGLGPVSDVRRTLTPGHPEVQIVYDRERMSQLGLDPAAVARLVRDKVQGAVPTKLKRAEERIDIRVRNREQDRATIAELGRLDVNPGGTAPIPLSSVAALTVSEGPSEIRRVDQQRVASLFCTVSGAGLTGAAEAVDEALAGMEWPDGFGYRIGGQAKELADSSAGLYLALGLSLFLVYICMASLFESFLHPFLIMFTVPLAFFGVVAGIFLTGLNLSVMVFLGMLILGGVVVNNAIVLVDYCNHLRAQGKDLRDAILEAGVVRMRPILMTTLTTVLGLLPMAFAHGEGYELRAPLAITVIFGLGMSTLLTLVVIPVLYETAERRRRAGAVHVD